MRKTKKQNRYQFDHEKKRQSKPVSMQVTRYISEGNPNTQDKIEEATGTPVPQAGEVEKQHRDEQIVKDLQVALEKEPALSHVVPTVRISIDQGILTLKGMVFTQEEKTAIIDKAIALVGLNQVRDLLELRNES